MKKQRSEREDSGQRVSTRKGGPMGCEPSAPSALALGLGASSTAPPLCWQVEGRGRPSGSARLLAII